MILLAVIRLGNPAFMVLLTILTFLGAREIYHMALASGHHPLPAPGTVIAVLFIILPYFMPRYSVSLMIYLTAAALVIPLVWLIILRSQHKNIRGNWLWTIIPVFYLGWTLQHYVKLIDFPHGKEWVLIAMLPTFACDTIAYFIGKKWGKHKLAPTISPNKTWEGAGSGFGAALGTTILFTFIFRKYVSAFSLSYPHAVLLGCLTGVYAQLGDLLGSRMKRITGVKDSGSILPGHGGIIDRIGSLIFPGLIIYYYVSCFVH